MSVFAQNAIIKSTSASRGEKRSLNANGNSKQGSYSYSAVSDSEIDHMEMGHSDSESDDESVAEEEQGKCSTRCKMATAGAVASLVAVGVVTGFYFNMGKKSDESVPAPKPTGPKPQVKQVDPKRARATLNKYAHDTDKPTGPKAPVKPVPEPPVKQVDLARARAALSKHAHDEGKKAINHKRDDAIKAQVNDWLVAHPFATVDPPAEEAALPPMPQAIRDNVLHGTPITPEEQMVQKFEELRRQSKATQIQAAARGMAPRSELKQHRLEEKRLVNRVKRAARAGLDLIYGGGKRANAAASKACRATVKAAKVGIIGTAAVGAVGAAVLAPSEYVCDGATCPAIYSAGNRSAAPVQDLLKEAYCENALYAKDILREQRDVAAETARPYVNSAIEGAQHARAVSGQYVDNAIEAAQPYVDIAAAHAQYAREMAHNGAQRTKQLKTQAYTYADEKSRAALAAAQDSIAAAGAEVRAKYEALRNKFASDDSMFEDAQDMDDNASFTLEEGQFFDAEEDLSAPVPMPAGFYESM